MTAARTSALTPRDVARWDLCESIASALANAEAFMREVEAHHAALIAGPHTEAQRYASLSDVLLSHRVLGLLRPASEALPHAPAQTVTTPPAARRVVHPPAPGWARAPEEVMGGTIGGLAHSLHTMAGCKHFDLHVDQDDGYLWLLCDGGTKASASYATMAQVFPNASNPIISGLPGGEHA